MTEYFVGVGKLPPGEKWYHALIKLESLDPTQYVWGHIEVRAQSLKEAKTLVSCLKHPQATVTWLEEMDG